MTEVPRSVVLHYHLFKNAGTSVDQMLKSHFAERWVTTEFDMSGGDNSAQVGDWIASNPNAAAFSSHTMVGPLPEVEGVTIVPIIVLRDPIDRIASAYRFERKQDADTWGANLAKEHDLAGYVEARLARANDRQCRNFQVSRLASFFPGSGSELERAKSGVKMISDNGIVGRVEAFDRFATTLQERLAPHFEGFAPKAARANTTTKAKDPLDAGLLATLKEANADDLRLVAYAAEIEAGA